MSGWMLYWFLKLDDISSTLGLIWVVWLIIVIATFVVILFKCVDDVSFDEWSDRWKLILKSNFLKFYTIVAIISIIFSTLLPSTKQMAIIYVVPKVANSDLVQEIPKKLLTLSNEWLEELRPEKNKEGEKTSDNSASTQSEKASD